MSEHRETWVRYIREVTRFDRYGLLDLVAEVSCNHMMKEQAAADIGREWHEEGPLQPFALAGIARDVILDGNETATKIPRTSDLERLCVRYLNLDDPISRPGSRHGSIANYMVRIAYEQFRYQLSPHNELLRSWALFAETAATMAVASMTDDAWSESLGCSVEEYIRIAFAWHTAAIANRGWVDPAILRDPGLLTFLGTMSAADVWAVTTKRLSASIHQLKADPGNIKVPKALEKHRYNPLIARPYVRVGGRLLAPVPQLAIQRAWPNGLYYDRVGDPGFTDDLGDVFEAYVGRQLAVLDSAGIAQVLPKVRFSRGKGTEESVDLFVIFPDIILLVEAKATRLAAEARLGMARLSKDVERTLGVAYTQIGATADLIRAGNPDFRHLPSDRPMLGLAVTLEPYWLIWGPSQLPSMPLAITTYPVSCSEIEGLVSAALAGPVSDALLGLTKPTDGGSREFNTAFAGKPKIGNPILDAAFDHVLGHVSP